MEGFQPVRLAYNTHEPVGGADKNLSPVIFLHALCSFKETWGDIPQTAANSTKRLCYSVDTRNHGDSEWSDEFSYDLNVNDLIHFMDIHGIKKAILVGHSMGGITTMRTALKAPNRVEKIVVVDINVQMQSQQGLDLVCEYLQVMRQAVDEAPADLDEDGIKKFIVQKLLSHITPEMRDQFRSRRDQNPDPMTRFISMKRGSDGRYTFKYNMDVIIRALRNTKTLLSEPKGVFEGPTCFVFGTVSPFYEDADLEKLQQFFPKAIVEVIEDVGHDLHISKPLELTSILLKFLS